MAHFHDFCRRVFFFEALTEAIRALSPEDRDRRGVAPTHGLAFTTLGPMSTTSSSSSTTTSAGGAYIHTLDAYGIIESAAHLVPIGG